MQIGLPSQLRFQFWKQLIHYKILLSIHTMPQWVIRKWQFWYIRRLVQLATQIPFYQEFYGKAGTVPPEIKNWDDFGRIPLTSKQEFRAYPISKCMLPGIPDYAYTWKQTSGSSGDPFRFPGNRFYFFRKKFNLIGVSWNIYVNRFLYWQGVPYAKAGQLKVAELRVNHRPRGGTYLHLPVADLRNDPLGLVEKLIDFNPDILDGRTTALVELARVLGHFPPNSRPHIPYLVVHGEQVYPSHRQLIEKVFFTKAYGRYGLEETGDLAMECKFHDGYHIHEESFFVEILNEQGRSLPPGGWGRIVVTNLFSFIMPFIRYDTGDWGMIMPGSCPCGILARKIKIAGRRNSIFFTLKGKKYSTGEFEVVISDFAASILRCQIVKINEEKLEIRIIPISGYGEKEFINLKKRFQEQIGIFPDICIIDIIPFSQGGKTVFFVDESKKNDTQSITTH